MGFEASYQGVLVCSFILKRLCSPLLPTPSLYISQDQKIKKFEKKMWELNPTWIEHATFWSGVRRATIAPRIHLLLQVTNNRY